MANPIALNRPEESEDGGKMSFFEHLAGRRTRLIHAAGAIVAGTFIGVYVAKDLLDFVARPMGGAVRAPPLQDQPILTHHAVHPHHDITLAPDLGILIAAAYDLDL